MEEKMWTLTTAPKTTGMVERVKCRDEENKDSETNEDNNDECIQL